MATYLTTHLASKLVVNGVARLGGYDAPFKWPADESHVADDVKHLVACRFVFPHQWFGIEEAELGCIFVLNAYFIGKAVKAFL